MKYRKLIASLFLTLAIVGSGTIAVTAAPRPAHALFGAGDVVFDPTNFVKNTITALFSAKGLTNPIFYHIAQSAIQSMVRSTVRWINSGFQGSPAYATDLKASLQDAADQEAQKFLTDLQTSAGLQSNFRDAIAQQVLQQYYLSTSRDGFAIQNAYTLNQYSPDPQGLSQGDLSKGGLLAFVVQAQPQNNWLGAQDIFSQALAGRVGSVRSQLATEVQQNGGFFSYRVCDQKAPLSGSTGGASGSLPVLTQTGTDANGNPIYAQTGSQTVNTAVTLTANNTCLQSHVETPGSVIAANLNHALGLGADSLVQAKDFDEIVNALMAQLMNQVLGPTGLGGLSQGTAANNGSTYFNQTSTNTVSSSGASVTAPFFQVIDTQVQALQQYLANWQTLSSAALAAKAAISASTCMLDAQKQSNLDSIVQPTIDAAAKVIGTVPQQITTISNLRTQVLNSSTQSESQQTTTLADVSAQYNNLLSQNVFPDTTDLSYAATQAADSGSSTPVSLYTQLNNLTAQARCQ